MRLNELIKKLTEHDTIIIVTGNPTSKRRYSFVRKLQRSNYIAEKVVVRKFYGENPPISDIDIIQISSALDLPEGWDQ